MKTRANFLKREKWWVAWTEDVPGALTQGETLEEARENLVDAVRMIQEPVDLLQLPKGEGCGRRNRGMSEAARADSPPRTFWLRPCP